MNAIHFFNAYYGVPIIKDFFIRRPQDIKKDSKREIGFPKLVPLVNVYDPATTSLEDAMGIARMSMASEFDYLNTEKIKAPTAEEIETPGGGEIETPTGEKKKRKKRKKGSTGKFTRTGNWVEVRRNHFPKGGDGFSWLIITERGYWSNIRNLSSLKHLGWDMPLLPFKPEDAPDTALFAFFKTWDKSPFLVIELITGIVDVSKFSLSHDPRHVVICSDRNHTLNLSQMYQQAQQSNKESEVKP